MLVSENTRSKEMPTTGVLSLRQALMVALRHNPELAPFAWESRAGAARTLQTGHLPSLWLFEKQKPAFVSGVMGELLCLVVGGRLYGCSKEA